MAYTKVGWEDYPSTSKPVNASNLNHMDLGIAQNAGDIASLQTDLNSVKDGLGTVSDQDLDSTVSSTATGVPSTQAVRNMFTSETFHKTISIAAGTAESDSFSIAKTGYTAFALEGFNLSNSGTSTGVSNCKIFEVWVAGTTVLYKIANLGSSKVTVQLDVKVAYHA